MFAPKKTVNSILAAFTKTIEDLESVEQSSKQEATNKAEQAAQLTKEAGAATDEAKRARSVADNLRSIINLETFKQ